MHAKTETNAKILSLLYPATPNRGVFKIKKKKSENTMVFKNFKKIMAWYLASPTYRTFKNFEKKNEKVPRKSKLRGTIRTNFRHFLGYPATASGGAPECKKK